MAPLVGLRVVDASQGVAGPYAALLLADGGADVIKFEHGDGDRSRNWEPRDARGGSVPFAALNRSKRGLRLDLADASAGPALERLAAAADVLILDADDAVLDATALGRKRAREINPRVVTCVISAFGEAGPWAGRPASELAAQLASEFSTALGTVGEPPVRHGADVASAFAGVHALQAVMAALVARERHGAGEEVVVSLFGSLVTMRSTLWVAQSDPDAWGGFHLDNYVKPPFHGYRCADGLVYFQVRGISPEQHQALRDELGMDWARDDPLYDILATDAAGGGGWNAHRVVHLWERAFARLTCAEIIDIVERHGGNAAPVNSYADVLSDPQVVHLGVVRHLADGTGYLRPPWQFAGSAPAAAFGAPVAPASPAEGTDGGAPWT